MTSRQRRILGVLVVANGVLILALTLFVILFSAFPSSPLLSMLGLRNPSGSLSSQQCEQRAVQMISEAGLGGTVTVIPRRSLQMDLAYPLAGGERLDAAAQQIWTAFDVAVTLTKEKCDIVSRIEVRLEPQPQNAKNPTQLLASVDVADLIAFHNGELSEREFIDQVQYQVRSPTGQ